MPALVNRTSSTGPGFAWQNAIRGDSHWWDLLAEDPILGPRLDRVKPHPNGCWFLEMAPGNQAGHILLNAGAVGRRVYAHRRAYEVARGPIPRGRVVRHSCDDPACLYPGHLLVGTQGQNVHDAIKRDRRNAFGHQRLTLGQVLVMRSRFANGETQRALSRAFDVSKGCVHAVVHRLTWAHAERLASEIQIEASRQDRVSHVHAPTVAAHGLRAQSNSLAPKAVGR